MNDIVVAYTALTKRIERNNTKQAELAGQLKALQKELTGAGLTAFESVPEELKILEAKKQKIAKKLNKILDKIGRVLND